VTAVLILEAALSCSLRNAVIPKLCTCLEINSQVWTQELLIWTVGILFPSLIQPHHQLGIRVKCVAGECFGFCFNYTLQFGIILQPWFPSTTEVTCLVRLFKSSNTVISKYICVKEKVRKNLSEQPNPLGYRRSFQNKYKHNNVIIKQFRFT